MLVYRSVTSNKSSSFRFIIRRYRWVSSGELFPDPLDGNEQNEASNDVQGKLVRVVADPGGCMLARLVGNEGMNPSPTYQPGKVDSLIPYG